METQPEKNQTSRIRFPMNIPPLCFAVFDLFWRGIHKSQLFSQQRHRPVHSCVPFFCWHTHCLLQLASLAVESSAARDVILQSWHASCRVFTALVSDMFERHISERVSVLVNIEACLFSRAGSCEHRVVKILSMHFKSAVSTRKALWWQRCVRLEHDPLCVVTVAWKYDLNQKKGHEKFDLYNQ